MSRASGDGVPLDPAPGPAVALPADLTELVGREKELDEVAALFSTPACRLVTLTGCPAAGKSRVGDRAAKLLAANFPDGVIPSELGDIAEGDTAQLLTRLLTDCGIRDNVADSAQSRLLAHLRDRTTLLFLDDCDPVVEAVSSLVRVLLRGAPGLRVLATSRTKLDVPGEHLYVVPPLDTADAVRLLVARAAAAAVTVSPEDPDAHELCVLLDGHPAIIEHVAPRIRLLGLPKVLDQLREPVGLVRDVEPAPHAMHPVHHAIMGWSYDQLSAPAKRMWAILAEFRVPFTATRACEVCAELDMGDEEAMSLLLHLLDCSILAVVPEPDGHRAGETRLRMQGPVRDYGRQLQPPGLDRGTIRRAHASYFAGLAHRAATSWYGPNEVEWLRTMATATCSVEAAAMYFLAQGEHERALALAVDTCGTRVHMYAGLLEPGRRLLANTLAHQPADIGPTVLHISAVSLLAWLTFCQGQEDAATELLQRALAMAAELGGPPVPALLFTLGIGMAVGRDSTLWPHCVAILDQAAAVSAEAGDHTGAARSRLFAGIGAAFHSGPESIRRAEALVADAETLGARWAVSWAHWTRALAEQQHGDVERAGAALSSALTIHRELDDTAGMTWSVWLAAVIASTQGRHVEAATLYGAVEALQHVTGLKVRMGPFLRVETAARGGSRDLDDDALRAGYEHGRGLDYRRAVDLALSTVNHQVCVNDAGGLLTPRELQVIELIARGASNRTIADTLSMALRTVESHVSNMLEKVPGVSRRAGLAAWWAARDQSRIEDARSQTVTDTRSSARSETR